MSRARALSAAAIVVLGLLTYANSLSSPFVFDDAVTVHDNASIRHLWPLRAALSPPAHDTPVSGRPLVNLSLAINYAAGGLDPYGYHLVNVATHIVCALLLFGIVRRTLIHAAQPLSSSSDSRPEGLRYEKPAVAAVGQVAQARGQKSAAAQVAQPFRAATRADGRPKGLRYDWPASAAATSHPYPTVLALSCAAIWLVHPLESEVADYVSARTESFMAMFYLLTLYASIRSANARGRSIWTPAAVAACAFGMACKESMATAPLMVVLYDRVFRFPSWTQAIRSRWPLYAALAASWAVLAALSWHGPRAQSAGFSADAGLVTVVSPWVYLLNQAIMIVRYLRLVVWPVGLVLDYGAARPVTPGDAAPYALAIAGLLAAASAAWIPRLRGGAFAFLAAWFFITLAPASSLLPVYTEVGAERRMYLPMMAVAVAAVIAAARLCGLTAGRPGSPASQAARGSRYALPGFVAVMVVMCGALASATAGRNAEYASGLSIWQTVVDRYPHGRARYHLALELEAAGRQDESMIQLSEAVRDYPDARSILGFTLLDAGRLDDGIDELRTFIRERPSHVNVVVAHGRLADALSARQRYAEAAGEYRQYLTHRPEATVGWTNFGIALAASGRTDEAVHAFERAAAIEPLSGGAHRNLANALLGRGDADAAAQQAQEAVRLAPQDGVAREILELRSRHGSTKYEV